MKLFVAHHEGHFIGGCSIVIAETEEKALVLLKAQLKKEGLGTHPRIGELEEVDLSREKAVVLFNGDY